MGGLEFSTLTLPEIEDRLKGERYEKFKNNLSAILFTQRSFTFENEASPQGPWADLKGTITKKRGGKERKVRLLRDTGVLVSSFTPVPGPGSSFKETLITKDEVEIITNVEYAAIHNFGGDIAHPGTQDGFGKGIEIPPHTITIEARPFDQFTLDDLEEINELFDRFINGT